MMVSCLPRRSLGSRVKLAKSKKWAPVRWNPRCRRIFCHTSSSDLESLMKVFLAMPGQKLAICPSINSSVWFFCSLVCRWPSGTSDPSSVNPWCGDCADFFDQLADRYGTNLSSRDRQYNRFWRQLSNDVIVSLSVKDHCFGARWDAAITTDSWAIMRYPSVKVRVHENIWHHQGSDLCIKSSICWGW